MQSAGHAELRAFLGDNERALASYAKRLALGDDSLAREYYQQMCLKLVEAEWSPGTAEAPLAYVKRVLLNGVRDRARREAARPVVLVGDLGSLDHAAATPHQPDPTGEEASARADAERSRARLVAALSQLSREQRTAVILRLAEDLSYAEIAEWTGRKEKTVRSDVARGLRKLRVALVGSGSSRGPSWPNHGARWRPWPRSRRQPPAWRRRPVPRREAAAVGAGPAAASCTWGLAPRGRPAAVPLLTHGRPEVPQPGLPPGHGVHPRQRRAHPGWPDPPGPCTCVPWETSRSDVVGRAAANNESLCRPLPRAEPGISSRQPHECSSSAPEPRHLYEAGTAMPQWPQWRLQRVVDASRAAHCPRVKNAQSERCCRCVARPSWVG